MLAPVPLRKEGLLWKKARGRSHLGVMYKPWALRWVSYEGGLLQYYKQDGGLWGSGSRRRQSNAMALRGSIMVKDAEVSCAEHEGRQFCIVLKNCKNMENGTLEELYLAAANAEDMGDWVYILSGGRIKPTEAFIDRRKSGGVPVVALQRAVSRAAPRIKELYDVQEKLGRGGFSVVKKGVCRETGEVWALKLIQNSVFSKHKQRTEEEVKVLASLDHPGIVKLREVVRTDRYFVIVMEFLQGGELFDRIVERKKYHEFDAMVVAARILNAIRYLHENDIVHRDIKPENLIFDKPGDDAQLKLTDFGFATMYDRKQKLTATCGTPEYVAPEILNEQSYTTSVDMWSCGVVIYILLCGFPPFYGHTEPELFDRICKGRYTFVKPYWDAVSAPAKDLVKGLLEVNPNKRLTAQQALNHVWFKDVVGDVMRSQAPPVSESSADLSRALRELQRYNASRKLRKGVIAVIAANRLKTGVEALKVKVDRAGIE